MENVTPDATDIQKIREQVEARKKEYEQLKTRVEIPSQFVRDALGAMELGDGMLYAEIHAGKFFFRALHVGVPDTDQVGAAAPSLLQIGELPVDAMQRAQGCRSYVRLRWHGRVQIYKGAKQRKKPPAFRPAA